MNSHTNLPQEANADLTPEQSEMKDAMIDEIIYKNNYILVLLWKLEECQQHAQEVCNQVSTVTEQEIQGMSFPKEDSDKHWAQVSPTQAVPNKNMDVAQLRTILAKQLILKEGAIKNVKETFEYIKVPIPPVLENLSKIHGVDSRTYLASLGENLTLPPLAETVSQSQVNNTTSSSIPHSPLPSINSLVTGLDLQSQTSSNTSPPISVQARPKQAATAKAARRGARAKNTASPSLSSVSQPQTPNSNLVAEQTLHEPTTNKRRRTNQNNAVSSSQLPSTPHSPLPSFNSLVTGLVGLQSPTSSNTLPPVSVPARPKQAARPKGRPSAQAKNTTSLSLFSSAPQSQTPNNNLIAEQTLQQQPSTPNFNILSPSFNGIFSPLPNAQPQTPNTEQTSIFSPSNPYGL